MFLKRAFQTKGFVTNFAHVVALFVMNIFHVELNICLRGKCFVTDPVFYILLDSVIRFKMFHQETFVTEVFDTFTTAEIFAWIMHGTCMLYQVASLTEGFLTGIALVVTLFVMDSFHMELNIRL